MVQGSPGHGLDDTVRYIHRPWREEKRFRCHFILCGLRVVCFSRRLVADVEENTSVLIWLDAAGVEFHFSPKQPESLNPFQKPTIPGASAQSENGPSVGFEIYPNKISPVPIKFRKRHRFQEAFETAFQEMPRFGLSSPLQRPTPTRP